MVIGITFGQKFKTIAGEDPSQTPSFHYLPTSMPGRIGWNPDTCTACMMCVEDCPSNSLELVSVSVDENRYVMLYNIGKCIFCGQCVLSCEPGSITAPKEFKEMATADKNRFVCYFGRFEDVKAYLENIKK